MNGRVPDELKQFLACPDYRFCGSAIGKDSDRLRVDFGISIDKQMELQEEIVKINPGIVSRGLNILSEEVGIALTKKTPLSWKNWDAQQLKPAQIDYAAKDTFVSYKVGLKCWKVGHVRDNFGY